MDAAPLRSVIAHEALQKLSGSSIASAVKLGSLPSRGGPRGAWPLALPFSSALPEGGFPQGSVVELASPANLGRGASVALAACAAAQKASFEKGRPMAWCAFLDPDQTLFGPAVQANGVCLERLLVLRPPRHLLSRVAVRVAKSGIFSVIAIDVSGVPGSRAHDKSTRASESMDVWAKVTRRLALAVEKTHTTVLLLTKSEAARASALPTAMRVELENENRDTLLVRIAKEKFGRVSGARRIAWTRPEPRSFPLRASG
jgi:hypothetical protein